MLVLKGRCSGIGVHFNVTIHLARDNGCAFCAANCRLTHNKKNNIKGLKISICPFLRPYFQFIVELCTSLSEYFVCVCVCDCVNVSMNDFFVHSNVVHLKIIANCQKNSHDTPMPMPMTMSALCWYWIGILFWCKKKEKRNVSSNLSRAYRTGVFIIWGVLITWMWQQCSVIFFHLYCIAFLFFRYLCLFFSILASCWSVCFVWLIF